MTHHFFLLHVTFSEGLGRLHSNFEILFLEATEAFFPRWYTCPSSYKQRGKIYAQSSGNLFTGSKNSLSVCENFAMINYILQFVKNGSAEYDWREGNSRSPQVNLLLFLIAHRKIFPNLIIRAKLSTGVLRLGLD